MVAGFSDTALDDLRLGAQADGRLAQRLTEVPQAPAADVAELDPLQVPPDALVRVQVRGVGRQRFDPEALAADLRQQVLDRLPAVDRPAVPDHQQRVRDDLQQVAEEARHVGALEGALLGHEEQVAVRADAADDREVVAAERHPQDRGLPARGVGADGPGQQVEAGLVEPEDHPPFFISPFLSAGQRSAYQAAMAASSRWVARRIGFWTLQPTARSRRLTWAGW